MADNNLLEQMLEHLVNEDKEKAEELFHQYVVEKSREIYENLIEDEVEEIEEATDEEKDEDDDDDKEDEVEESFEELDDTDLEEADPTDDLVSDVEDEMDMDDEEGDMDMDDEEGEESEEDLFQDLDDIVDQLQAKFDELKGDEGEGEDDMEMDIDDEDGDMEMEMDSEEEVEDSFDAELATVREYVERITGGHGAEQKGSAESADNKKSTIDNMKNDMGGTASNLNQGEEAKGGSDKGLSDTSPKDMNAGNVNTPGSKTATKMSSVAKGHGAEKKGSAESADNNDSLFRG